MISHKEINIGFTILKIQQITSKAYIVVKLVDLVGNCVLTSMTIGHCVAVTVLI